VTAGPAAPPHTRGRLDLPAAGLGSMLYSFALGVGSVALPLIALDSGYSGIEVGILTAVSALAQMSARTVLGRAMRLIADRHLVLGAALLLAVSTALLLVSTHVVVFVLVQLMQGASRACFWTGSQTHVVRGPGSSVASLALVNFISSLGMLAGPPVAGVLLETGSASSLVAATVAALAAAPVTLLLDRLPVFTEPPDRPPGRIWRRPGVDAGCWAGVTAGAWRGLVSSYVPVALTHAGQSSTTVGALVSVANGASVVAAGAVARVRGSATPVVFAIGVLATGIGTAVVAAVAGSALLAAAALAVSGLGAGALQTIGPAVATDAVHPEERGEAIAAAGAFRAAALFGSPLAVAGLIAVLPLTGAMALVGVIMVGPVLAGRHLATPSPGTPRDPHLVD
jgi:MFS family permease